MIQYHVSEGICVLRLDSPPLNTITFALLEALRAAVRRGNQEPGVRGLLIIGGADHFSAGADVNLLKDVSSAEEALRTSRVFQEAFQELEDSPRPLAAAVAGRVRRSACPWWKSSAARPRPAA
jgi:enoyl-CoA hydratase/carnithine racemase